jgi:hypothetical protein
VRDAVHQWSTLPRSGCPNQHKVWDPNALPLSQSSRPDRQYGEWVSRDHLAATTEISENPETGKGRDGSYVTYAQEKQRPRDPKCREEKQEVDHASSEKEAEKLVSEYKTSYDRGWKVCRGLEKSRLRRCYQRRLEKLLPPSCGICNSFDVHFDNWLDINVCYKCGARETVSRWQKR